MLPRRYATRLHHTASTHTFTIFYALATIFFLRAPRRALMPRYALPRYIYMPRFIFFDAAAYFDISLFHADSPMPIRLPC